MNPADQLIEWYESHGRDLPWRETTDPYKIWISEIILQQTRVRQGIGYYNRFIERFPDLRALAEASQEEVLKYWEGLGYYSRARNLHHTAGVILNDLEGKFPESSSELQKLKGIGPYTACAIASFAFGEQVGVVDGNVFRVLSRYLEDPSPIDIPATRKKFQQILNSWLTNMRPAPFNHGIMDIGATICTPTNPSCSDCPLQDHCKAYQHSTQEAFPVKSKKLKRTAKFYHFYLQENGSGEILIRRRPQSGVWAGLWEIPNEELDKDTWLSKAFDEASFMEFKHVFTHFDMHLRVFVNSKNFGIKDPACKYVAKENLNIFAFPKAVLKILDRYLGENL